MNDRHSAVSRWTMPGLLALAIALGRIADGAVTASSEQPGFPAQAAVDGDRFAYTGARLGRSSQRTDLVVAEGVHRAPDGRGHCANRRRP